MNGIILSGKIVVDRAWLAGLIQDIADLERERQSLREDLERIQRAIALPLARLSGPNRANIP